MDIWPDTLEQAKWTFTADVDLASATAEVYLGAAWRSLTWTGAATGTGPYTRVAQVLVAGANPSSGIKVTEADSQPLLRVTVGGEVLERRSSRRFYLR